jgi:PAS domain S-box-containing protein
MDDSLPHRRADRRQLQQIIAGLTEGVILIDPDQTIGWANEAALAMHGVEAIEELGADVTEYRQRFELRYRNNHKLGDGDHPMQRVLAGEAFQDVVVEVAPAGEDEPRWVHRIRSLVLTDTAGDPDCLVLVLHDATERFEAEERFERTFAANPAPAIICRLSDLRYVKVNQGFLEMTGYTCEDVIGRSAYEIDVLEQAEKKDLAVERLNEGRTIPQMEAVLKLSDGGTKFVIVAGQPIEIADDICMLFTFTDLEPRKKAEDALRQSEERFAKAFRLAPVPTTISALNGFRILNVNEAFVTATGYAVEEAVARTALELQLWRPPALRKALEQELEKTGSVRNLEIQMRTKEGDVLDCLVSAETVTIQGKVCVLSVLQDITERKRSEAELIVAIEAVMRDTSWFSRTVIEKLANLRHPHRADRAPAAVDDLTPRERDILGLVCQGLADKEIANRLALSNSTVRNTVSAIYRKIGVRRRSAAVIWARERGFTGNGPKKLERRGRKA